jgi:leucyl/phenylalanyl-tRNA--protein transferase
MSIIDKRGNQRPTQKDFFALSSSPEEMCPMFLLTQLARGVFAWDHDSKGRTQWWCPYPRCVLETAGVKKSRSLRKTLRSQKFSVKSDQRFVDVVNYCANTRNKTWISPQMIEVLSRLHVMGHAHSFETYTNGKLVGGFYGIAIGRMFFGESMFSLVSDASKVALVKGCEWLSHHRFPLIDVQMGSSHQVSMGASFMPRDEFLAVCRVLVNQHPILGRWEIEDFQQKK